LTREPSVRCTHGSCGAAASPRAHALRSAGLGAALLAAFASIAACGQRGPLTLPDSARPIERLDPNAQPAGPGAPNGAAQPGSASGTTPPAQREPGSEGDDEARRRER
jgi:predicted small lipoprotein YifL